MVIDTRRIRAGLLALALVLTAASSAAAQAPEGEADAPTPPRLSYLDGPVSFWRPGAESWTPAEMNLALAPGDELHTGHRGNVEAQVGARAFVRAWGDTRVAVVDHTDRLLRLRVSDGHVAVDARALEPGLVIEVQAPGASFAIDRAGYYRIDVDTGATTFITRRDHHATMTRVVGGSTQTSAAPEADVWDRWNQARTDELLRTVSAQYVPQGVYGLHDLDHHGGWRVVPTYGAVWVPRGAPAGWAPYTTGRWLWDPRFGWTWVDTAVWGWAPFHHGRWIYLDGLWAWAPGPRLVRPVYAPALVAFFSAPGVRVSVGTPFVSWVALGWGEPVVPWWGRPGFVGRPAWHGWGGPRIVNNVVVHRTTVVHADEVHVYRNTRVHRAVVAVPPERFGRARVQDARVSAVDTGRLRPVRGPLPAVAEPERRGDSRGEPARVAPTPRAPQASRDPDPAPTATPRAQPRREPPTPRVVTDPRRDRPAEAPRPEPPRTEATRPTRPEPPRATPRNGGDAPPDATPRTEPARPELPARPARPRVDIPRPATPPRAEAPRAREQGRDVPAAPRVEAPRPAPAVGAPRPRPQMRDGDERPRPAAERIRPGGRGEIQPRRAPAASPALRGAAAPGSNRPAANGRAGRDAARGSR